jgi:hypothetical protein
MYFSTQRWLGRAPKVSVQSRELSFRMRVFLIGDLLAILVRVAVATTVRFLGSPDKSATAAMGAEQPGSWQKGLAKVAF